MHPTGSRRTARSAAPGTSRIAPGQGLAQGNGLGRWRDRPCGAHRASAEVLPLDWRGAPCGVASLRCSAAALMVCVAPVRVQEDPFAVMESCQKAIEGVLKRSVA